MYNIDDIKSNLKSSLDDRRYNHSLLVADSCKSLAKHYNLDEKKAYIAGLVHDICKCFSDEENSYYVDKYKIDKDYLDRDLKPVLHGIIGSYYVKEKYNMDDELSNAVKYHTLGNPNMTLFDKIVLVSDKIGRINPDKELIDLAYKNIDDALIYILEKQEKKLHSEGKNMHKDTIELLKKLKV